MVPFLGCGMTRIHVKMQSLPINLSLPCNIPPSGRREIRNMVIRQCVNTTTTTTTSHENSNSGHVAVVDVIVVGAGVAGSALARTLAEDGRRVHLIERDLREPNKVVGEILQPAGYLKLVDLGLEDCVKDIDSQMVEGYAVYKDADSHVKLPYPLGKYGRSFHHGRFLQKLRSAAASHPNVKMEQGTVTSLIEQGGEIRGVSYYKTSCCSNGNQQQAYAPLTVVCDGCFSTFRNFLSKPKINKASHFVCLTLKNCEVPHRNYGHALMGNPSTMIYYAISSTEVRFIIDFPGPKLPPIANGTMARFLKSTVVASQIPAGEMYNALMSAIEKDGGIRTMPVSCMPASPCLVPGAILLGDALNMRHAITGGGMTVALHDVALLSALFTSVDLDDTSTLVKFTRNFYNMRKPMVFSMNVMADSLHKLLCASPDDESRIQLQSAFFNYLSLGGVVVRGQALLISGLSSNPMTLVLNLLASAIYIFGAMLFPFPSPKKLSAAVQLLRATTAGVIPMILDEGLRQVFFTTNTYIPKSSLSGWESQKCKS